MQVHQGPHALCWPCGKPLWAKAEAERVEERETEIAAVAHGKATKPHGN